MIDETMQLIYSKTTTYGPARGQWMRTMQAIRRLPTAKTTA